MGQSQAELDAASGAVVILREPGRVRTDDRPTTDLWDRRWLLEGPHAPGLTVRPLGEAVRDCPNWHDIDLPWPVLLSSPAIWRGDTLIAAPVVGFNPDWSARIVADFRSFLLSH